MNPLVRRVFLLVLTVLFAALAASLTAMFLLYRAALAQQGDRLFERAQREARMIRAIIAHEREYGRASGDTSGTQNSELGIQNLGAGHVPGQGGLPLEATIGILRAAHERMGGFGPTGEYLVGQRQGDSMVFLVDTRQGGQAEVHSLPLDTDLAVPMRRALRDSSGVVVGRDYRGVMVMAGYAVVGSYNLGVVSKMDMAEVRAPYLRAGELGIGIAILAALFVTLLFLRITSPMLHRIAESEELFSSVFRLSPVAMSLTSATDGTYQDVNEAMLRDTGYTRDEIIGRTSRELAAVVKSEDPERLVAEVRRQGRVYGMPFEIRTRSGDIRPCLVYTGVVAVGGKRYFLSAILDITERHRAEKEQVRLTEALRQKNEELEQHVYAVSHDLRTPLVSVQGFVGELRLTLDELSALLAGPELPAEVRAKAARLLDEDIPTSLRYILAGTEKMSGLLAGMVRLSRLGRAALKLERLDMNRIAASAVAAHAFLIQQAGAKVELGDLPGCRADEQQVSQVLANLLSNAIKYRDPTRPPVVKLTGQRRGSMAEYCVEDNGIGIAPELHRKVYDLFYRANTNRGIGDGLGLTIVRRALGRLDGEIVLESEPGKGSRFCFTLPAGEEAEG